MASVRGGVFTKFDTLIQMNPDGTADFVGSNAEKIFGGPVPLTTDVAAENYYHFAEATTAPNGQDLMNGQALNDGIDYPISTLDVAVLKDIGVPVTATASDLAVYDTLTDEAVAATDTGYVGPVGGLQEQYVNVTQADLDISVSSPGWFIHSGSGTDAIAASSGANVIDGGTGSNFLSGGSGTDTFFVDTRDAAYDIWSTVDGFHAGDNVTLWGITQSGFDLTWGDGQGASGFTGLTLHATADGHPEASLTLSGYTTANIGDGSLGISFDTDPASGSPYMSIHANT